LKGGDFHMGHGTARLLLYFVLATLICLLLPIGAFALSVCVADFSNETRFCSYDPLPDNLVFYMKGNPNLDVIDRWRVRGEINPSQGIDKMAEGARSLGADILVSGSVTENSGKIVAKMVAYKLPQITDPAYQVVVDNASDCRDAASKASAALRQQIVPEMTVPAAEAPDPVVRANVGYSSVLPEQQALADRALQVRAGNRKISDVSIKAGDVVTERDFARVIARLANCFRVSYDKVFTVVDPSAPVTMQRAVSSLSYGLGQGELADSSTNSTTALTRAGLAKLLTEYFPSTTGKSEKVDKPTGLIIDTRGLGLERSITPVIECEDGRCVYPDKKHLPSIDYIEDQGIASFVNDLLNAPRTGDHPLIVKAIGVKGSASQIAVISTEDADAIIKAAENSDFMKDWKVTFLLDKGY
jgi:hypothetical protein